MNVKQAVDAIITARAAEKAAREAKEWLEEEHGVKAGAILKGSLGSLVVTRETQMRLDQESVKEFLGISKYKEFMKTVSFFKMTVMKKES